MPCALALALASLAGLAFVDNILWWYPIRFGLGASLTLFFVVSEYAVNALAPENKRGLWIGIYSTSLYLGFALGPAIIGLVGTPEQTKAAEKSFGAMSEAQAPDEFGNYLVNHTASVFLIGADGRFEGTIAYGEDKAAALAKIKRLTGV